MVLLGLPWIIGYFIIDTEKTLVFAYLFTIVNSSQGTIIFILRCIASKSVRKEIIKHLSCKKTDFKVISDSSIKSTTISKTSSSYNNSVDRPICFRNSYKKENSSKLIDQILSCMKKKNVYETKNETLSNNTMNNSSSSSCQTESTLKFKHDTLLSEDDSHSKLLIYESMPNYLTNSQHKNPFFFQPYCQRDNLPKRTSSHVSSNSSNSNRTHLTYVPSFIPTIEAQQQQFFRHPSSHNTFKQRHSSHQYYLIPRSTPHDSLRIKTLNDSFSNYANQNLPTPPPLPPPPPMPTIESNAEEHNYSLIENELQTAEMQYYCDESLFIPDIEETDFKFNNYTDVAPNQYDELDDIKILGSSTSSFSSFNKEIPNRIKTNQMISIPKNASVLKARYKS